VTIPDRRDGGTPQPQQSRRLCEREDRAVGAAKSKEGQFRQLFLSALDTETAPALSALGFEIKGPGGYSLQWNEAFELATNIRESKNNRFGAEQFEVLISIWMMEAPDRHVRGIWLPIPNGWKFDDPETMGAVGNRLLAGVLRSAIPLAVERWGLPSKVEIAEVASETPANVAREIGSWHIPGGEP
jgi:hypothetical protein